MEEKNRSGQRGELFALRPVPKEEQKSWFAIVCVQTGMIICIPAFLLGALLAQGMSTFNAILAGIIGYFIVLILTFILGMQGADLHMPTCVIAQSTFGTKGTRLFVSSIFTISLVAFFGLQVNVCGEAFCNMLYESFGIEFPVMLSSLIWGVIMTLIAVVGMEALKNFDAVSIPLLLITMVLGTVLAFRLYGSVGLVDNEVLEPTMTLAEGVGLAFSFFSAAAFTAPDVTKFQKSRKDTILSSIWGLMPAGIITLVIGVLLTRVAGIYDITLVLAYVGLPIIGIITMIVAAISTNSLNAYCGGIDLVMTLNLPDHRRREATAIVSIFGIILAVLGILDFIEEFLNWIAFLGAPTAGIMIADYWIVGKGKKENWHPGDGFNWLGISALMITLVICLFIPFGVFNANGIVVGIIVYVILERFIPSKSRPSLNGNHETR